MTIKLDEISAFWEWFDETRGDLSIRRVEDRAASPRGRIGNAYSTKKEPSFLVCRSIANGLMVDLGDVLYRAGYLKRHEMSGDPYFEALKALWDKVPDWKKKDIVTQLRAIVTEECEQGAVRRTAQKKDEDQ